jgi:hypothetical protein
MRRRKGFVHQRVCYPGLLKEWQENARRKRWGKPLKPLPNAGRWGDACGSSVTVAVGNTGWR